MAFARAPNEMELDNIPFRIVADLQETRIIEIQMVAEFQGKLRTRAIAEIQGIVLPSAGLLRFRVLIGEAERGHWNIEVSQIGAPHVDLFSSPTGPTGPVGPSASA